MLKKQKISDSRWNKVSDIFADVAQVIFATAVVPILLGNRNATVLLSGLVLSAILWVLSVLMRK